LSTPDGENCGLVKNLAVTAIVSSRVVQPLIESFISCGMSKLNDIPTEHIQRMDKIFLNGNWVGSCKDSASFVFRLRCMRRSSMIDPQVLSLSHGWSLSASTYLQPLLRCLVCRFHILQRFVLEESQFPVIDFTKAFHL